MIPPPEPVETRERWLADLEVHLQRKRRTAALRVELAAARAYAKAARHQQRLRRARVGEPQPKGDEVTATIDVKADWRDLPKGKYLYPHLDGDGNEIAFSLWVRTVPRAYKTGRTVGRHGIVHMVRRAPGVDLPRETVNQIFQPWSKDQMLREFLDAPDLYRALYGQHDGHCGICGRTLTDPTSRERGIGPECATDLGIIGNRSLAQRLGAVTVTAEDVARLRREVADAHPDRGGSAETFRLKYAEYSTAKARLSTAEPEPALF